MVVVGEDAEAVGREVRRRRQAGQRAAGFVGSDEGVAREMAAEMLGGVDEVVAIGLPPG